MVGKPYAAAEDIKLVEDALHRFNFEATQIIYARQPVSVFLKTAGGQIKGGLIGRILVGLRAPLPGDFTKETSA